MRATGERGIEMNEQVDIVLGFDPGGANNYGWSICKIDNCSLSIYKTGVASHAKEVIETVSAALPPNARVLAAGIDAPMFWSDIGGRQVDKIVREAITHHGCRTAPGTVQHVNALRGAVLVQGVLLGSYVHQKFNVPITEAHPTALLQLPGAAIPCRLRAKLERLGNERSEHERDAVLAAFAAWSMHNRSPGWRNLYCEEPNPILPLETPISYWMPIPEG